MSDPRASAAVSAAVFRGQLAPVTSQPCVDCGAIATAYDHYKGYARAHWLDVEPVCDGCNARRSYKSTAPRGDHLGVLLRLSRELVEAVDADAKAESRSRNAQIAWILRERYRERGLEIKEDRAAYVVAVIN